MRNGRLAGQSQPYLHELTGFVADLMQGAYPELRGEHSTRGAASFAKKKTATQPHSKSPNDFSTTKRSRPSTASCPAAAAFKLYDTYGLALDEQEEMAREFGLTIDRDSFTAEMEKQRSRARASWRGADKAQIADVYRELPAAEFIGRETFGSAG